MKQVQDHNKKMLKKLYKSIRNTLLAPLVWQDFTDFKKLSKDNRFSLLVKDFFPQPFDKTRTTGFDRHYVYHTAWAARCVKKINPEKHIDIASSLYFSALVSAFVPVDFYDFRPADLKLSNLNSQPIDITNIPWPDNSVSSLSCMHTIEHIGLGRYGDSLDPDGDVKAIKELSRVLAPEGNLLFVVPIGKSAKIMFNAHRIYTYDMIIRLFPDLNLKEFAYIPEHHGKIQINPKVGTLNIGEYDCGCFWFVK